jgi:FkbM family methyltransferase
MKSEEKIRHRIVEKKIGAKILRMKNSHNLPFYLGEYPLYDRALPRIARMVNELDGHLHFIDVGANIGDTVALVTDKTNGSFLCIEGDPDYLPFLKINVSRIKKSKIIIQDTYCGNIQDQQLQILNIDGTARLKETRKIKDNRIKIQGLGSIVRRYTEFSRKTNLLKIDTDGFEISVLESGKKFIREKQPVIFFEFDPKFYLEHVDDPLKIFDILFELGYGEGLVYDNFGVPISIVKINDRKSIEILVEKIDFKNIYYFDILVIPDSRKEYRCLFEEELIANTNLLGGLYKGEKKAKNLLANNQRDSLKYANSIKSELESTKFQLDSVAAELLSVYASKSWKLATIMQNFLQFLLPVGSRRRRAVALSLRILRKIKRIPARVLREIRNAFFLLEMMFNKNRKIKRNVNKESKKVVYIGHSYHIKTKSTAFLIDYLKEFYQVEVIKDESWRGEGEEYPDLSHIDGSYLAVIFFQNLPLDINVIKNIDNKNIIFFPMYDAVGGWSYPDWRKFRNLKIINFSRTLHEKLLKWGLESYHVQYFPKPQKFYPGKAGEAFFWQRVANINVNTISDLLGQENVCLHVHRATDPGQKYIAPTNEQMKQFKMTFSDWFEKREEMWDLIMHKAIYVAPRVYEGIGLSFLEAMAMGKAVIAVDNPTMNEYIINNKTGYLFDLSNPKAIDFSQINNIQKNTYKYMVTGHKKWQKEKRRIISAIEG